MLTSRMDRPVHAAHFCDGRVAPRLRTVVVLLERVRAVAVLERPRPVQDEPAVHIPLPLAGLLVEPERGPREAPVAVEPEPGLQGVAAAGHLAGEHLEAPV